MLGFAIDRACIFPKEIRQILWLDYPDSMPSEPCMPQSRSANAMIFRTQTAASIGQRCARTAGHAPARGRAIQHHHGILAGSERQTL